MSWSICHQTELIGTIDYIPLVLKSFSKTEILILFPPSVLFVFVLEKYVMYPSLYFNVVASHIQRNPKYPDFKHKDTGEALWIEGRNNPPWVKAQLAILDTRMGSFNNQDSRLEANLLPGDNFSLF